MTPATVLVSLADALDIPTIDHWQEVTAADGSGTVLLIQADKRPFLVQVEARSNPGEIVAAAQRVRALADQHPQAPVPVVMTPFMTPAAREACNREAISWADLSGNARITATGLRIRLEGRPNRFKRRGRPSSAFAPKSSRIARWLLGHDSARPTQRELAQAIGISEGSVSRIVRRLESERYLERGPENGLRVRDRRLLLSAWRESYDFDKHDRVAGHVATRSGPQLSELVSDHLREAHIEHAATGLAAAWQYCRFANYRLSSFYVMTPPSAELLASLGFREGERGANLWLISPNDAGVIQGAEEVDGISCVLPVQAWLDLEAHPERSREAADRLAAEFLQGIAT